jgi:NADP-dependent 3-hydroxy acid dehydrogenase YdfG
MTHVDPVARLRSLSAQNVPPRGALREVTEQLLAERGVQSRAEYDRFQRTRQRTIRLVDTGLLAGRTVLVTGGTGCIGSRLLEQLAALSPRRLVSVARGWTRPSATIAGVDYLHADVADAQAITRLLASVKPEFVFHLAAQRDPGAAERTIVQTLRTNVGGTLNVLAAAKASGVRRMVYASTGKAMRPFTADTYAASKKIGEWLVAEAYSNDLCCSSVRFTHVVDNSLIDARLLEWTCSDAPVQLHDAEIAFYIQSATESAQLLIAAAVEAPRELTMLHAIRYLEQPVNLLDLALGAIQRHDSRSAIRVRGYENGYESHVFPALFDPMTALETSPLFSAFEAGEARSVHSSPEIDAFPLGFSASSEALALTERLCSTTRLHEAAALRDELSWELLRARLPRVPIQPRLRALRTLARRPDLLPEHYRIADELAMSADPALSSRVSSSAATA